jgi:arabinoxylan arabinofuranohydrolase
MTHWITRGGKLSLEECLGHNGKKSVRLTGRTAGWQGPGFDVTEILRDRGPGEYFFQAYVRTPTGSKSVMNAQVTVMLNQGSYPSSAMTPLKPDAWTPLTTVQKLTWEGQLKHAMLYIQTSGTGDLVVDDYSLVKYRYRAPKRPDQPPAKAEPPAVTK